MLEAAGITLRDSIEAILVIFVMLAYLKRSGQENRKRYIYGGASIAVIISIAAGIILSHIGVNPENEWVEGMLYFASAILVGSLTIWMIRHSSDLKSDIEEKMQKSSSGMMLGFIAFVMVLREGAEIVVFMQSLLLAGNTPVQNFLGGVMGMVLSIIFGFVFLWGTTKIHMGRFFKVTSVILAILVLQLTANGFHELFEIGVLPSTEMVMLGIGFLAKDSTGTLIIALMLFALILLVMYDLIKSHPPEFSGLKPTDRRKKRYRFYKEKYAKMSLSGLLIFLAVPLFSTTVATSSLVVPEPASVTPVNGVITIDIPQEDGLYKYEYEGIRLLVTRKEGEVKAALDRCYICPPTGYGYNGEQLVCQTCSAPIDPSTIGHAGGCNPKVIDYETGSDTISISADELTTHWGQ
ncbi:Fe-S-containing protein [Fodinibius sediminis]|uniref:FTR1 family protein n=1 Tax=Fodinibius sediminis TaxID=1214077 RepID=A0A521CYA8_9BACT|nr:Fe-S-containing protein [Fodinibius sediminis]SMO64404.1 FTR1 family protein [Fodinibius sediminis]